MDDTKIEPMPRFPKHVAVSKGLIVIIADDGTIWRMRDGDYDWSELPSLPKHGSK